MKLWPSLSASMSVPRHWQPSERPKVTSLKRPPLSRPGSRSLSPDTNRGAPGSR